MDKKTDRRSGWSAVIDIVQAVPGWGQALVVAFVWTGLTIEAGDSDRAILGSMVALTLLCLVGWLIGRFALGVYRGYRS